MLLDIFGSVVIAGLLFIMMVRLNLFSSQTSYISDSELKLQTNTKTLAEILDYDLRKIGYRHEGTAIILADSTHLTFMADIDSNGTAEEVEYFVGDSTEATGTLNPSDIILKRTIDGGNLMSGSSLNLVKLKFTYLDEFSNKISYLNSGRYDDIKYIRTEMWLAGDDPIPDAYADTSSYTLTYWEFTIYPRNI
ncbi:MAG TPA: hypothetical protein DHV28_06480 [Ignavibacteriales bacterium]|nr:hypothetical protein [Ignavibacteriales bacterium]